MQPLLPWRCIGWSDLTLNFFVVASSGRADFASPDGWVADGAEALIELVSNLGDVSFSVHLLARDETDASVTLCRVSALWKELEVKDSDVVGYWYSTTDGQTRPCSPIASATRAERPRLTKLLNFEDS
ncbi:hypothetical protein [Paraburkholderia sp. RL17-337-BIB-A]|uniref:hypothetical protein n=1 Tax=Paraburkholderia sp. RL17-337-BIB-A TaxID=3031636 RepID=UPI0038BD18FF